MFLIRWLQGSRQRAEALAENMTEQLRISEERYREMFEGNKAVELLVDPENGAIVDANQAAENYYGYSREELKRMNIAEINTLSAEELSREMQRANEERRHHFLFKHRHATGEVRDVEVHSGPIVVAGKKLLYSIIHDVTARMESERALRESEERYHTIIDTTGEGYWLIELASFRIIEVNDALCRMLGYRREEMIGRQPFEFADDENSRVFAYQATQIRSSRQRSYEIVLQHKDGHDVFVRINATNMPNGEDESGQAFAFITDISESKRAEEELRIAATFFETTSEAITVTDTDNRIVAVNPAFTSITGYTEAETLGRDPGFLSSGRNNAAFYRNMWQTLERMGRWQGEIWNRRKNGEIFPEWLSIVAIRDDKGVVKQYMAVFSDITKRKRDEEKIWRQANYDALTGLPNRNLFKDRLDQAMHAAHREGERLALMFIDLDRFKWVNDTLGHASGDLLLQETAARLQHSVRETDTVARLGGDEFTVLLNDIHNTGDVDRIAENLLKRLSEPFDLEGREAFVSGSIGITLYPGDAEDMEQLLGNADAAMYIAKDAGRNVFRYFTQEMNEAAQRRLGLESDLRRVLERGELLLHYQPIVDGNAEVRGAEALLRWQHPEYGFVPPDEFIPLAEEIGVIVPIEQWVMRQACSDAAQFRQHVPGDFFVSVNISSVQCKSDQCRQVIGSVLADSGLPPSCLKLEITERVMMENTEHVIALLKEVRAMGVRLAVDDFGTGYSSLSYLKQFPVDVLKIDRAFVDGLPEDRDDVALVEAIVAMAHSLNLQVVGEGVETAEQLAFLRSLGCDLIQGYYFSRPVAYQGFIDYLDNGGNTGRG
jgi:diguanylate cyclase (GGDEF)-like protein/PAS domain S-box-containing protein